MAITNTATTATSGVISQVNAGIAKKQETVDYGLYNPKIIEVNNDPPFKILDTEHKPYTTTATTPGEKVPYFPTKTTIEDLDIQILDRDWIKQAFLVPSSALDETSPDAVNRYWSSASNKFVDTRLGGNLGINARPQFTRYSDIRVKGRLKDRKSVSINNVGGNYGMGRYYSEAIDDNAQTIYLRFGLPQFNSLGSFFSKAFDKTAISMARTGRGPGFFYRVGQIAGTVAVVSAFPALTATMVIGRLVSTFFTRPTSKFYTLKPAMHLYWSAVNMMASTIAINKGLIPRIMDDGSGDNQSIGNPYKLDKGFLDQLHNLMPDVFNSQYGFDIFAVANKAQRIANKLQSEDYERYNVGSASDFVGKVKKDGQATLTHPSGEHSLGNWLNEVGKLDYYVSGSDDKDSRLELNPKTNQTTGEDAGADNPEKDGFVKFFDAEFREGAGFAIFKVDHTGAVSEAFSNSATESDLSQKFNSVGSQVREAKFSFANGNITGSALEEGVKGILGSVTDVVTGALDGVTFGLSNILAGAGSGYIDIPKHWQSSAAQLTRSSYTIKLISPYGNIISQMQNIFIPLSMLLAGALPLSTGKQSYTSPFLCQLFDRGRSQIQLGMIESLSVTRGTANLPFNNRGQVMAIDVTFTVADLSSIMHMPLSTGSLFGTDSHQAIMDEDNILMDYLAVLAGQDMYSQIYALPKAKLNFAKTVASLEKLTSPAYWASFVHQETTTGMLGWTQVGNILEGMAVGASVVPSGSPNI